jgi:hypothetical protein
VNILNVATYSRSSFWFTYSKRNKSLTIAAHVMCLIYMISMHFSHRNSTYPFYSRKTYEMQILSIAFQVQDAYTSQSSLKVHMYSSMPPFYSSIPLKRNTSYHKWIVVLVSGVLKLNAVHKLRTNLG